jgi:hypothetical protein
MRPTRSSAALLLLFSLVLLFSSQVVKSVINRRTQCKYEESHTPDAAGVDIELASAFNFGLHHHGSWHFAQSGVPCLSTNISQKASFSFHILLFGDSLDRYLIREGCLLWDSNVFDWGQDILKYVHGGALFCETFWGSVSYLHLYGARPAGPYAGHMANSVTDEYVDTPRRLTKALSLYRENFGRSPTVIVYQAGLWDIELYGGNMPHATNFTADEKLMFTAQFQADVERNYNLIRRLEPLSRVFFRTTPVAPHQILQAEFNAGIRRLGVRRGVGVLDWDLMLRTEVWSGIFRDNVHPRDDLIQSFHRALIQFASCFAADGHGPL